MHKILKLALAIALPLAVGGIAGYFTASSVDGWFQTIQKPSFNPPGAVFAPVWTTLYILMGIASYLVWQRPAPDGIKRKAGIFYFLQLLLNFSWSFVFFYLQQPGWAVVNIVLLWLLIAGTIFWFSKISKPAAWLLIPYILWVSFATALNFAIWQLNS